MLAPALALLALLSGVLMLWQWIAGVRFPLGERRPVPASLPSVTVLKPVKDADAGTREALATWLHQDYPGPCDVVLGAESADDPACAVIRNLLAQPPPIPAVLRLCPDAMGINRKVSTLVQMAQGLRSELVVVSDADVAVPPDLLAQIAAPFADPAVGLVHCLYRFQGSPTPATRWEAFVVNADFWSQVLQNQTLHPLNYALGAVMALRRTDLAAIGGFEAIADHLADDNQLGRRIVGLGRHTHLCPVVVDCQVAPGGWREVWLHQLRWAVTIRVCRRGPYFLSILANGTLWPLLWAASVPSRWSIPTAAGLALLRVVQGLCLEARFTERRPDWARWWLVPFKDLVQVGLWAGAFLKNRVVWRNTSYRVRRDGRLESIAPPRDTRQR